MPNISGGTDLVAFVQERRDWEQKPEINKPSKGKSPMHTHVCTHWEGRKVKENGILRLKGRQEWDPGREPKQIQEEGQGRRKDGEEKRLKVTNRPCREMGKANTEKSCLGLSQHSVVMQSLCLPSWSLHFHVFIFILLYFMQKAFWLFQ